ncbi:MAG: carboxymuconolactone decarboxylase family protein [Phycisphaerales bacterium]|nr:MAG: carboxymuconolactone decarboxylase family protein [Phycisphaerales bacterium]
MQRIPALDISSAPDGSKAALEQIKAKFGKVPNIFASIAHSPAALNTLMGMFGALEEGALAGKAQQAISLRVGQIHGCAYCTAAHTAKAKMTGMTTDETIALRKGESDDPKLKAILNLTAALVEKRGQVSDGEVEAARDAGLSNAEMLETLAIVVKNTFTNYMNALVQTKVDFPAVPAVD